MKFKTLPYRTKNSLLNAGIVLLILIVYQLGIRRTLNARSEYAMLEEKVSKAADIPRETIMLEKELARMEAGISVLGKEGAGQEEELIDLITAYCQSKEVVLREFPQQVIADQGELLVETHRFVVQGNFHDLLELVYTLEQKKQLGKVSSVQYELKKDMKSKKNVLTAIVFLQNIKKKQS